MMRLEETTLVASVSRTGIQVIILNIDDVDVKQPQCSSDNLTCGFSVISTGRDNHHTP